MAEVGAASGCASAAERGVGGREEDVHESASLEPGGGYDSRTGGATGRRSKDGEGREISGTAAAADHGSSSFRGEEIDQSSGGTGKREEVPEEWDADNQSSPKLDETITGPDEKQNDIRLHAFLTTQFGTTLPQRLTPLKDGHAVKIR